MSPAEPQLSRFRNFLFVALILVWFSEMLFHGLESLGKVWAYLWQVQLPTDPALAKAVLLSWSVAAPCKGALCVMAVFALLSKDPRLRTALFISMALVPPLNIAFPFRQQGFLLAPVTVATVLSTILWGSFLIFRERAATVRPAAAVPMPRSGRDLVSDLWFGTYATVLTLLSLLMLFRPSASLDWILPCLAGWRDADSEVASSLVHTTLGSGTHMAAVTVACWFATINGRRIPALRRALTLAGTTHAGLFLVFPLRRIAHDFGNDCAASSILRFFVPLFIIWVLYAVFLGRTNPASAAEPA